MLEMKISELRKFQKNIGKLSFVLTPMKDKKGQFRLRLGKKYIILDCPSKEIGESVKAAIMAALKSTNEKISQIIEHIERNAEQLTLELFPVMEEGKESDDELKECSDRS